MRARSRSRHSASEPQPRERGVVRANQPAAYGLAGLLVTVTTGLASAILSLYPVPDLEMLFLLTIMLTALWLGRGPSLLAAALCIACYDYFFVPPFYAFDVDDRRYFLTFGMMFGVSLLLSELASRLKRQERDAVSREERTSVLYSLSRELAAADDRAQIAGVAVRHAAEIS